MAPIDAGTGPVGFLKRYQAITLDQSRLEEKHRPAWGARDFRLYYLDTLCLRIVRSIADENRQIASKIRTYLISQVEDIASYDDAGVLMWKLSEIDGITRAEINRMLRAASENRQVYEAGSASSHIRTLVDRHRKNIGKAVLREFKRVRGGAI